MASQTVQVTIEAMTRPTMTTFTTTSAFMNMPQGDRSRGRTAIPSTGGCWLLCDCAAQWQRTRKRKRGERGRVGNICDEVKTCQYFSLANNRTLAPGRST